MIQEQIYTEAQARARGISMDTLIAPLLQDGYKIVERTDKHVKLKRYVNARHVRY